MKIRRTAATVTVASMTLLFSCGSSKTTSTASTSANPATTAAGTAGTAAGTATTTSAATAATSAGTAAAAGGDIPSAIKAAGGTSKIAGAPAAGIEAQYGPICKGADLGIGKIDFTKDTIGWAQSEKEANPFRIASTKSQVDEAKKRNIKLLTTNAQSDAQQENTDIKGMIDKGAKAIIFSPINSTGLGDAIAYAKSKHVAMIPVDRNITGVKGCADVGPQLGSDFVLQGRRAADAMIKATGGTAKLAILLGASGVNVTDDRTAGFKAELKDKNASGIQIVFEQTADFTREKGKSVTETLLQAHPDVTAIYAENDEMGLGALAALDDKGMSGIAKVHIVSIDGTKGAVQAIVDGNFDAVIESNPAYGPTAFAALDAYVNGDGAPAVTITTDNQYDKSNAQQALDSGTAY